MLFYKTCGTLLLLLCGLATGTLFLSLERRRCRQAEGFLRLIRHIRAQIDCFALPIGEILSGCDETLCRDCGFPHTVSDFPSLLAACEFCVPQEICELLAAFAARLGNGYRAEQLRCCDDCIERLAPCCEQLHTTLAAREKTAMILPLSLAACLALLLW